MNPEVAKVVQQLADKLGVTAQYLWAVLVRGNRVEGAIAALFVAVAVAIIYVGYRLVQKANAPEVYDGFGYGMAGVTSLILGIIMFLLCSHEAIMGIFCPEYGALHDILSRLR
jgi:hypothetical protein